MLFRSDGYLAGEWGSNFLVAGDDDTIIFADDNGSIWVTETAIIFADPEGNNITVTGEVTYDEDTESFTLTNDDGTLTFAKDGFIAFNEDNGEFIMGDFEGNVAYTDDKGMITVSGPDGECLSIRK